MKKLFHAKTKSELYWKICHLDSKCSMLSEFLGKNSIQMVYIIGSNILHFHMLIIWLSMIRYHVIRNCLCWNVISTERHHIFSLLSLYYLVQSLYQLKVCINSNIHKTIEQMFPLILVMKLYHEKETIEFRGKKITIPSIDDTKS